MKKRRFLEAHIEENGLKYIVASLLFVFGIIFGIVVMLKSDLESEKELADYFASAAVEAEGGFFKNFKSCMILHFKYLVILALLSAIPHMARICLSVCGLKGVSVGFCVTFLIKNYGNVGALYGLLAVMPSAALTLPVYAFAAVECIKLSGERTRRGIGRLRDMLFPLAVIYILMLISSLYDCTLTPIIFKRFF